MGRDHKRIHQPPAKLGGPGGFTALTGVNALLPSRAGERNVRADDGLVEMARGHHDYA